MRTAREEYPKAKSVELWWRLGVFVAMVRERGRVSVVNIPRRRARHPRG
jgi:ribose 1,5-bisphosphokinase PhnN